MRVDVIQIDAPGGAHTGEFARPATAVRVQGRDLGGKTGIAGLRAKPVGEGRREPARELARANRRRVEFGKLDEPPGEAVMEKDAVAMLYGGSRSEEHTSELQSLMRISYAVFCLKKKKNKRRS